MCHVKQYDFSEETNQTQTIISVRCTVGLDDMMMEVAVAMAANADFSAQVRKMTERCLRAGARVWSLATCLPDFRPICRVCRPTKFVNFAPLS